METLRWSFGSGKVNLHHAYIIEGSDVTGEILKFIEEISGITMRGNPDFHFIKTGTFNVNDARRITDLSLKRAFESSRRFFIVECVSMTEEAQNALLKLLEEPSLNTHYFLIAPNASIFLKTLISRCFVVRDGNARKNESIIDISLFLKLPPKDRLLAVKKIYDSDAPSGEIKGQAYSFLEALECYISSLQQTKSERIDALNQIISAKKYLMGSSPSVKMILEHVSLVLPPL